jgi:hypothetical protein
MAPKKLSTAAFVLAMCAVSAFYASHSHIQTTLMPSVPGGGALADLREAATARSVAHRMLLQEDLDVARPSLIPIDTQPAWRGRLDTRYARTFMAPSIAQMKCKDGAECSFQGREYPYEEYIADPTVPGSMQPVLKASYPKGSWSPASPKPGGTLFFAYPYRADPTGTDNPFSRKSAALEFEVYFPQDFDFVKGEQPAPPAARRPPPPCPRCQLFAPLTPWLDVDLQVASSRGCRAAPRAGAGAAAA